MISSKKEIILRLVLGVLILSLIAFIFTMSLADASTSTKESSWVLNLLNGFLEFFGLSFRFSHGFVRSLAHFLEFGLLGFLSYFFVLTYKKKLFVCLSAPLLFTLLIATVDEIIQLFSEGRAFQFTDILTDISGGALAILFAWVLSSMVTHIKNKKELNNVTDHK